MAEFSDHIDFQTILQTSVAPEVSLSTQLLLVDDDQIPIDTRYRFFTQDSYKTDLTSGTVPYDYSQKYFSQALVAPLVMIGRWAKVATNPSFVCGPNYETTLATWVAETAGSFKVVDNAGTPNEDEVTGVSFAAATSLAQVATILTAAIQAIATPNITGLDTSEFVFDSPGRLVLKMSTSGAAAASVSITTAASGSDISVPLLDAPNGTIVAGLDAEEPTDALTAISAIDNSYTNIHIRGESAAQQLALAAYVEATKDKLLDLWVSDAAAKNAALETDIGFLTKAAGYTQTNCIYSERTTEYGDACAAGRFLPAAPGTAMFSWNKLVGVNESGNPNPLSASDRVALEAKGYSWFETYSTGDTILYNGLTAGGIEKRVMIGKIWFDAKNTNDIWTYQINTPLVAFDNPSLTAIEGIIRTNATEAISRGILVDTVDRPFTLNFPDADDITQAQRASHTLTVLEAYKGYLNSEVHDYQITGTWTI